MYVYIRIYVCVCAYTYNPHTRMKQIRSKQNYNRISVWAVTSFLFFINLTVGTGVLFTNINSQKYIFTTK